MKRDLVMWLLAALLAMVCGMAAWAFNQLADEVRELRQVADSLDDSLNETNLLLRANGISWPEPIRREDDEETP